VRRRHCFRISARGCSRVFRHGAGTFAIATTVVVCAAQIASAASPVPVIAKRGVNEIRPSASAGYLAWSQNSVSDPDHYSSYVMATGGDAIRLNERGTYSGGASIHGTSVLYEQSVRRQSDFRLYDVATGERTGPGVGVNTRHSEFEPNISAGHYFFARGTFGAASPRVQLVLYERATGRSRVLAEAHPGRVFLDPNQVNGDWVVWDRCRLTRNPFAFTNCQVIRYQISTQERVRVPNPGRQQGASAVTSDGTVYFGRVGHSDRWQCGSRAKLIRYPVGGPSTQIASLERGTDALAMFALEEAGTVTLYFHRFVCERDRSDIYKLEEASSA
jgi:hypothetical protein